MIGRFVTTTLSLPPSSTVPAWSHVTLKVSLPELDLLLGGLLAILVGVSVQVGDVSRAVIDVEAVDVPRAVIDVEAVVGLAVNVATTLASEVMLIVQPDVPEHPAPDHPANFDPEAGVAVRVTESRPSNLLEHVVPQLIPAGVLVTVPVPDPPSDTDSVCRGTTV